MLEISIEKRLEIGVKKAGGLALKTDIIPGQRGFPDRTVLMPGGRIFFIELKRPGKNPRAQQALKIKWLLNLGFKTLVIDTYDGVDKFLREVTS